MRPDRGEGSAWRDASPLLLTRSAAQGRFPAWSCRTRGGRLAASHAHRRDHAVRSLGVECALVLRCLPCAEGCCCPFALGDSPCQSRTFRCPARPRWRRACSGQQPLHGRPLPPPHAPPVQPSLQPAQPQQLPCALPSPRRPRRPRLQTCCPWSTKAIWRTCRLRGRSLNRLRYSRTTRSRQLRVLPARGAAPHWLPPQSSLAHSRQTCRRAPQGTCRGASATGRS